MTDSTELRRYKSKRKAALQAKLRLKQRFETIDFNLDVVIPNLEAISLAASEDLAIPELEVTDLSTEEEDGSS